jgi:hypothetical protein
MALLTEGGSASERVYKHGPPDGGPTTNHGLPPNDVLPGLDDKLSQLPETETTRQKWKAYAAAHPSDVEAALG